MTRGSSTTVENNFTKGLVTEYTSMNFPENAVTETDNCVYSDTGEVRRRLGMNIEFGGTEISIGSLSTIEDSSGAMTEFKWTSVGNNGAKTFIVQQIGRYISFFELTSGNSVSDGLKIFNLNLVDYKAPTASNSDVVNSQAQFASGKGYLFISHPFCDPVYIQYDSANDTIAPSKIVIQVRDLDGVDDNMGIDQRLATMTNLHKYNLWNQGWYITARCSDSADSDEGDLHNVLDFYRSRAGYYPSNADIWWVMKNPTDVLTKQNLQKMNFGNTPAPKGHYIYNAFDIDRTSKTGISGLPRETSGAARPSCIAFYAGRVFYAGVAQDGFADTVYFSQIIEGTKQFGMCYQNNDPTSETTYDLLDSDGGTLSLPLAERIVSMQVVGDALIIQSTNGHFVVRGSDNGPFRATNYTVEYISNIGALSQSSVVNVDGGLMFFNQDGLYILGQDQAGLSYSVNSASLSTIQSLIEEIPSENIPYIKGVYNRKDQIVMWLFSSEDNSKYRYNRILEFNVRSGAFYPHTIDTTDRKLTGIFVTPGQVISRQPELVTTLMGEEVVTQFGELVYSGETATRPTAELFKFSYLTDDMDFCFSELSDLTYVDWEEHPFVSYGVSGYRIRGELLRPFNSSTVAYSMKQVPGSKLTLQGLWDYGMRKTEQYQIYRENPFVGYITRRIKLRGKGKSLQIAFRSVGNAPFFIAGWSTFDSGGMAP